MTFIWPVMLVSMLVIPVFIVLYILLQQRRRKLAARYGNLGFLQAAAGGGLGKRRHLPPILFIFSLAILMFALARPQAKVTLPKQEGTIILAFDISGSMAANDLKPNRMEAAKAAAREFIERQPTGVQVGIVAFSDSGFVVQPPTNDPEALFATINRLAPQRGTSISEGIIASVNVIAGGPGTLTEASGDSESPQQLVGSFDNAIIVLLTDGENNIPPDPFEAARTAANLSVRIYPVGIGSPQGALLDIDGFKILTQLNEDTLNGIAQLTGGTYYNAQTEQELRSIYSELAPKLVMKEEKIELTSLLAGASLLVMLIGGVFSFTWFNRIP